MLTDHVSTNTVKLDATTLCIIGDTAAKENTRNCLRKTVIKPVDIVKKTLLIQTCKKFFLQTDCTIKILNTLKTISQTATKTNIVIRQLIETNILLIDIIRTKQERGNVNL